MRSARALAASIRTRQGDRARGAASSLCMHCYRPLSSAEVIAPGRAHGVLCGWPLGEQHKTGTGRAVEIGRQLLMEDRSPLGSSREAPSLEECQVTAEGLPTRWTGLPPILEITLLMFSMCAASDRSVAGDDSAHAFADRGQDVDNQWSPPSPVPIRPHGGEPMQEPDGALAAESLRASSTPWSDTRRAASSPESACQRHDAGLGKQPVVFVATRSTTADFGISGKPHRECGDQPDGHKTDRP